jgi:hypothetical protein
LVWQDDEDVIWPEEADRVMRFLGQSRQRWNDWHQPRSRPNFAATAYVYTDPDHLQPVAKPSIAWTCRYGDQPRATLHANTVQFARIAANNAFVGRAQHGKIVASQGSVVQAATRGP